MLAVDNMVDEDSLLRRLEAILSEMGRVVSVEIPCSHPLSRLHWASSRLHGLALEGLMAIEPILDGYEASYKVALGRLRSSYGPGYLTVKCVRNKLGNMYRYPVYRVVFPRPRDVYLGREGLELLKLRYKIRTFRELMGYFKAFKTISWAYMMSTRHYAHNCINV